VKDEYEIPVAAGAPPGKYRLEVGMYLLSTGERLPVLDEKGSVADNRILLPVTVQVVRK